MKNLRNDAAKTLIVIALCSSAIFADGEMGGGGLADSGNVGTGAKTVIVQTTEDGEMGGGGRTSDPGYVESIMSSIYTYFDWNR